MPKPRRSRLVISAGVLLMALVAPPALAQDEGPIADPLPNPTMSQQGLVLKEFATLPKSEPVPPSTDPRLQRWARINYLGEVPDGSRRLYVPDLNGKLHLLDRAGASREYLDVAAAVGPDFWSHRGLGSGFGFVAFHPGFKQNGTFYTVHTEARDALTAKPVDLPAPATTRVHSVITEWTADNPAAGTFSGTRREVMRLGFQDTYHDIQEINFNPNSRPGGRDYGLLYVAAGDGGAGAGGAVPQDLAAPQGKILRIDPRGGNGPGGKYGIPSTNPFVGRPGVLGEIYAYGLRDPHRFSWDTGGRRQMFIGHIGEHRVESVYEARAGDNFGWSNREGPFAYRKADNPTCGVFPLPADDASNGYTYPVAAFDHNPPADRPCSDSGNALIGGFVYRGARIPELYGKYIYAEGVGGRIFSSDVRQMRRGGPLAEVHQLQVLDAGGAPTSMQTLAGHPRVDLRFGTDSTGELYVLSKANGKIWQVTDLATPREAVIPSLRPNLVAHYDFGHSAPGDPGREQDRGRSGTDIQLVNGGAQMRVNDSRRGLVLRTQQLSPTTAGNDDWKAGVFGAEGVPTLSAFNGVRETTVMGWFKMTGEDPGPGLNSNSADPDDRYGAIGLAGVLSGTSQGHDVRALLELITVDGEMKAVALGRRVDGGSSQTFAADADWKTLLPPDTWVFLAATFDYDDGTMALYRNGRPVPGSYTLTGDPWAVEGLPEPDAASQADPRGIKIGGSYPQNTREGNPCDCRMDDLMFLDRAVTPGEVMAQYRRSLR
jgi:glucose/arabinose dehydrogenase